MLTTQVRLVMVYRVLARTEDRSSNIPHTSTRPDGADDQDGPSCSDLESTKTGHY